MTKNWKGHGTEDEDRLRNRSANRNILRNLHFFTRRIILGGRNANEPILRIPVTAYGVTTRGGSNHRVSILSL